MIPKKVNKSNTNCSYYRYVFLAFQLLFLPSDLALPQVGITVLIYNENELQNKAEFLVIYCCSYC